MRTLFRMVGGLVLVCAAAGAARAQAPAGVAGLLPNLILSGIRLDSGTNPPHDVHFSPLNEQSVGTSPSSGERFQVDAAEVVLNFNRLMATQFATFPIGSSSGAFSFRTDEATGLPRYLFFIRTFYSRLTLFIEVDEAEDVGRDGIVGVEALHLFCEMQAGQIELFDAGGFLLREFAFDGNRRPIRLKPFEQLLTIEIENFCQLT